MSPVISPPLPGHTSKQFKKHSFSVEEKPQTSADLIEVVSEEEEATEQVADECEDTLAVAPEEATEDEEEKALHLSHSSFIANCNQF